jgi:putative autoinducer-2 (AI-2) aldolase
MGRNIFQAEAPVAMIQAVRKVVHENMSPEHAFDFYQSAKKQPRKR